MTRLFLSRKLNNSVSEQFINPIESPSTLLLSHLRGLVLLPPHTPQKRKDPGMNCRVTSHKTLPLYVEVILSPSDHQLLHSLSRHGLNWGGSKH